MDVSQTTAIAFDKTKATLGLLVALVLFGIGVWGFSSFVWGHETSGKAHATDLFCYPLLIVIGLFHVCEYLRKVTSKRPAFVISPGGVLDQSRMLSPRRMAWADITGSRRVIWRYRKGWFWTVTRKSLVLRLRGGRSTTITDRCLTHNFDSLCAIFDAYAAVYAPHAQSVESDPGRERRRAYD